ncbi:lysostaphin resistance A-like protein [Paraclostridium sp. AKS73]|uniref:CPBP family intramembrane glutamic endopeptidase n=1 Tax=Paraclostridium sp. AKS73 TaxID=2876116 RepID=UPI0039F828F5|nr:CPBP family intramembrane metalloprotease [Paraclostridium sp. AKS73]
MILQSLIFGISHGNVLQGMYTFIGGILLSLICLYCDSIAGSILLHIVFNLFGSVILPSLLFKQNSINYLIVIIGVIVFIFSTFKILADYKTCTNNVSNLS